ncbi:uncharacterized protein TNCV_4476701 [Trichonephila clavipes]|nr:uncharacterized protein TNCV_4476701 [Trichonephila clavipes]
MPRGGAFHYLTVSYRKQDKTSKGNGCDIQHDFMLLTVRYVTIDVNDNNEPDSIRINETFLGFIEAANQTAKSLESDVLNFLNILDINLVKCRGRGYDGATNISGMYGGLQKLIKDKPPRANYVHCSTHNLNLVLNDACYIVPHGATKIMIENWVASIESLRNTDLTSKALQSPKIDLENAKTMLNSSLTSIENLRNNFANIKEEAIGLAKK